MSSRQMERDEVGKDMLSGSIYAREARPHITKGGCNDLDDLCDTRDTLAVGVGKQLHDGRVHPYFARRSSHCAGGRPLSETITLFTRWGKEGKADAKGV
jgi:hypothetical protein